MHMRILIAGGVLALLGADMTGTGAEASVQRRHTAASLCTEGETPIFQCRIGQRMVAVCGGRAGGRPYAQYRFGRPGALELSYPGGPGQGAGTMVRSLIPFSGGGEAQIHFTTAGHQYLVYSRVLRTRFDRSGRNDAAFSAGLAVWRNGRRISNRGCSDGDSANVDLAAAEPFVPDGAAVESEH
jgi:hypothetical protein